MRIHSVVAFLAVVSSAGSLGAQIQIQKPGPKVSVPLAPKVNLPPLKAPATSSAPSAPPAPPAPPAVVPRDPAPPSLPPLPAGPLAESALVSDPGPQSPLSASVDPSGNLYFTTIEADRSLKLRKLSASGVTEWQKVLSVGNNGAVAIAGNDGVLVVSPETVVRFDSAGNQQFSTRLGQSTGGAVHAAYDGAGGVFVAFLPYPSTGRVLLRVDRYGRVTFRSPAMAAGPSDMEVAITTDASGNVLVATGGDQVTLRKLSPTGAELFNRPITAVFGVKKNVGITHDDKGGAIVGWSDARRRPQAVDLFVQAVDATGRARWTADGVEIVRDPGNLGKLSVASDGVGGAYVGYATSASSVQRVNKDGIPSWTAPATLGAGRVPLLMRDGSGVFAVTRKNGDGGPCLTVLRLTGLGAPLSPDGAKTVGTCIYTVPIFPVIVRTQPVIIYTDTRSGYADVYMWR